MDRKLLLVIVTVLVEKKEVLIEIKLVVQKKTSYNVIEK